MLRPAVSRPVYLDVKPQLRLCLCQKVAEFVGVGYTVTRGRDCLYNYCCFGRAVILGSESPTGLGTDHILLSQIRDPPKPGGPCPPRIRVFQLYPGH
jgi:hypothetical protein